MTHCTVSSPTVPEQENGREPIMEVILHLPQEVAVRPRRPGRPYELLSGHFALAILWCVWQGWNSQRSVWRLICVGFGPFACLHLTDDALYKRLERQGVQVMKGLFEQVTTWLHEVMTPWQDVRLAPFAREIYLLDESVLDQVKRWLPTDRQRPTGDKELLAGRLAGLFDVRRQLWVQLDLLHSATANCKVHARAMLAGVKAGDLLLFDLGYYAFEWLDELTKATIFWISRQRQAISVTSLHVLLECEGLRDELVKLGAYRADRGETTVRLVSVLVEGIWHQYLTNVLDPRVLPASEIVRLYARRWDIEMAFRLLKEYLGLRILWSAKWHVIGVQVWACAILAQILHSWQMRLAAQEQVEPEEISMKLLVQQSRRWTAEGRDVQALIHEHGRELGIIRPSSRRKMQVIEVPAQAVAWPPPAGVLEPRQARYGHRKINTVPRIRKKKGVKTERGLSSTKKVRTKTKKTRHKGPCSRGSDPSECRK